MQWSDSEGGFSSLAFSLPLCCLLYWGQCYTGDSVFVHVILGTSFTGDGLFAQVTPGMVYLHRLYGDGAFVQVILGTL